MFCLCCLVLFFPFGVTFAAGSIAHYQPIFLPFAFENTIRIATRTFEQHGQSRVLAVDPFTLETEVIPG